MNFKSWINENYTYQDALELDIPVTKELAKKEVLNHGDESDWEKFVAEIGDKAMYGAKELLTWLGY